RRPGSLVKRGAGGRWASASCPRRSPACPRVGTGGRTAGAPSDLGRTHSGRGPALGREIEIAQLLSFIKHRRVHNVVWLTADVHYTAAHYYDPHQAQFQDFEPFWEFVSGPLHAGTFGPNDLDNTFGVDVKYAKAPATGQVNLPP